MQTVVRVGLGLTFLSAALAVGGCGDDGSAPAATGRPTTSNPPPATEIAQLFPDVIDATATLADDGTWSFDVTISSPYDTATRYADAWRVLGDDGTVYGVRELTHGHPGEQPFTRSLRGVVLPGGIVHVTIEGRDLVSGWGGETFTVALETT